MNSSNPKVGLKPKASLVRVGVTGSAGSGKTAVCNRLKALGLQVISTDALAREAVAPGSSGLAQIVALFGSKVLQADGGLNRSALRRTITRDEKARRLLENIIHPKIRERLEVETAGAVKEGRRFFFVEVPLLFEAGWNDYFDVVVMVSADDETRIGRLMARDNVSRQEASALLQIQLPDHEKIQRSEYIIKNNGSREELDAAVDGFLKRFCQKYQKIDESA